MSETLDPSEYDGIYFVPGDEDDEFKVTCWQFDANSKYYSTKPERLNEMGYTYHIAFFKTNDEGNPEFDEDYEVILGDPQAYVNGLADTGLFGCIVKKTEKSAEWFHNYLTTTKLQITMMAN